MSTVVQEELVKQEAEMKAMLQAMKAECRGRALFVTRSFDSGDSNE